MDTAEVQQLGQDGCIDGLGGVHHLAHACAAAPAGPDGWPRPARHLVHLGQPESKAPSAGHDHIGVPDQADARRRDRTRCTAAMTGTSTVVHRGEGGIAPLVGPDRARRSPSVFCISLMSTPALKPLPSERRTTTRVPASRPAAVTASASSNQPATVNALTGGQATTISAMPRSSTVVVIPIRPTLVVI